MTTVGYGDITAKNSQELIVANFTMFLAGGVFAFSVNSVGIVVQNIYKSKIDYKDKVKNVNNLMLKHKINQELQQRIRSYLEYIWGEEKQMDD